jgi:hypothetical protein
MLFHQLHPRRDRAAFQAKLLGQINAGQAFHEGKYRLCRCPIGNVGLAICPHFSVNAIRTEINKKLVPTHWLKPFFYVLYMFKVFHELRVSQADSTTQI